MSFDPSLDSSSASAPVELSDDELEQISGGIDVVITGVLFEQEMAIQQSNSEASLFARTSATMFQFVGTGFSSMKEVFSFVSSISRLFGR